MLKSHRINDPLAYKRKAVSFQPWLEKDAEIKREQKKWHSILSENANASISEDAFISLDANIFTQELVVGSNSWIAAGAVVRGTVRVGSESSINCYTHIAGKVKIGNDCRIASLVSIYGFNHGFSRIDQKIKDQPVTSEGVVIHDGVWIGANAVILDGVEIGHESIIAAGSIVTKSFPPFSIIAGNPARKIRNRLKEDVPLSVDQSIGKSKNRIRSILYDKDPYLNLQWRHSPDLQGWDSKHPIFSSVIMEIRPRLIVEVGTWKGGSAIHMGHICRDNGIDAEIVCVDTWLGNWQHWSRPDGVGSKADLRLVNGFPTLYWQFMSNVVEEGLTDLITPLPLTGIAGAYLFRNYNFIPDIVYIDGDHEYESVLFDLQSWLKVLSPAGVLIGDDYEWPGVKRAVQEIASDKSLKLQVLDNKFTLRYQ